MWRVHYLESERGWDRNEWHVDFDDEEDAREAFERGQRRESYTPDYYIISTSIEEL